MSPDEHWMDRALTLAEASLGFASPNPQVGCVLVKNDERIGEGAHLYDALDHAEIVALKQAATANLDPRGATAYVTLEPCSHQGRTGPCADALIAAGIARCVVATLDPNPAVSGRGLERMRAAGITVEIGLAQARARTLNNPFARSITSARPYITLKAALSVDGMLAPPASAARTPNQPFWLSGPQARAEVQHLRHRSDAVLTGIGTVLADDPLLTDRTALPRRRPLMRIVLDTHLRIPLTSQLVKTAQDDLWLFCGPWALPEKVHPLQALGIRVTTVPFAKTTRPPVLSLTRILEHIHKAKLLSVLLEAGSTLNGAFLQQHLVDEAILFYSNTELGPGALPFASGIASPFALEQTFLRVNKQPIGSDICVTGILSDPWQTLPGVS